MQKFNIVESCFLVHCEGQARKLSQKTHTAETCSGFGLRETAIT
jgi:hypothetical protein